MPNPSNLDLFFSYAHADQKLRDQLEKHLNPLKRQKVIRTWHDGELIAGHELDAEIAAHLESADIILFLVSTDFMDSYYCYEKEMTKALERYEAGLDKGIPVILRPVEDWQNGPLGKLVALPKNGRPVIKWKHRDDAFVDIAGGIRKAAMYAVRHCKEMTILENTMSNPKYATDLASLDGKWSLNAIMDGTTILIVTGNTVVTELLDRPTAEHLRDAIDERGDKRPFRRAVVISYGTWQQEIKRSVISKNSPVIAIGGPNANDLTKELGSSHSYIVAPGVHGSFRKLNGKPQVALWGDTARKTRASVENYIARTAGLEEFLKICWAAEGKS